MNFFRTNAKPQKDEEPQQQASALPDKWMLIHDTAGDKIVELSTNSVIAESKYDESARAAMKDLVEAANIGAKVRGR